MSSNGENDSVMNIIHVNPTEQNHLAKHLKCYKWLWIETIYDVIEVILYHNIIIFYIMYYFL